MRVIPVIDVKGGKVVRAVRGDRANYAPIDTRLAPGSSDPVTIAISLIKLCNDFDTLYVADIDAIADNRRDPDRAMAESISKALPGVTILLDDGSASAKSVGALASHPSIVPVIGTESLASSAALGEVSRALSGRFALSLDWKSDAPLGPLEVYDNTSLWPDVIIAMTLERVGSGQGPDFPRLQALKAKAGARDLLAAGGVRNMADLRSLKSMGCGALLASALHEGSIEPEELSRLLQY